MRGTVTLGPFGPEEPHQHDMSHANKLALLAYSKRAHSEWALLDKQEAELEKMNADERKAYLAKLKASAWQHLLVYTLLQQCRAWRKSLSTMVTQRICKNILVERADVPLIRCGVQPGACNDVEYIAHTRFCRTVQQVLRMHNAQHHHIIFTCFCHVAWTQPHLLLKLR